MKNYNSIIIGSGLGGLIAGATLALWGKKVIVLEQHYIAGGCATAFKRKDYLMEVGLHEIDGLHETDPKRPILELLGVFDEVEFLKVPEFYHLKKQNFQCTLHHGAEAKEKLIADFPDSKAEIECFFKLINRLYAEMRRLPRNKWLNILLYPLMPFLIPTIIKTSTMNTGDWLDANIKDEALKNLLTANLGYYTDDPYNLSLMYFLMAQGSYLNGGGNFVKGGSQSLSNYLVRFIEKRGGQVLTGKFVEEILVENNQAVGVSYRDTFNSAAAKQSLYADSVVANAAQPIVAQMLPEPYRSKLAQKLAPLELACSLLTIYLGFNTDLKKLGINHYSTIIQGQKDYKLKDVKADSQGDWAQKSFTFVNYGVVDAQLAPEGKTVGVICAIDYLKEWEGLSEVEYQQKKERIAQLFLARLETEFPTILEYLEYYEVATAKTIKRYTLNPQGTPYGYVQSVKQTYPKRDKLTTLPLKNLYFASAWAPSGGGYSGAIYSGFMTANKMKTQVKWRDYAPSTLTDERCVKLLAKDLIADNTILLTFEKPKDLAYQAGQYAVLRLDNPRYTALDIPLRPLSMVSHPKDDTLQFAMRLSDSSFKKSVAAMAIGDTATIFAPMGNFTLKAENKRIVFLASGIGITPVLPMLKTLAQQQFAGEVAVFYSNKTETSAAFHSELQHSTLANYSYLPVFTATQKRLNAAFLKEHLHTLTDCEYYIVGTHSFIKAMQELLLNEKVPAEFIFKDDFGSAS